MKPQNPRGGFPLNVHTIAHYKLLGDIEKSAIRKKIRNPKNGFYAIRTGGTDQNPYYGYTLADIVRYWREVCHHPKAEEFINGLIDAKNSEDARK